MEGVVCKTSVAMSRKRAWQDPEPTKRPVVIPTLAIYKQEFLSHYLTGRYTRTKTHRYALH